MGKTPQSLSRVGGAWSRELLPGVTRRQPDERLPGNTITPIRRRNESAAIFRGVIERAFIMRLLRQPCISFFLPIGARNFTDARAGC